MLNYSSSLLPEKDRLCLKGAKCSDGVVIITDRLLRGMSDVVIYKEKIFGDIEHVIIGYTGDVQMFDIIRRYTVVDVMIERDDSKRYTLDNLLSKLSNSVDTLNELVECRPFKVLMVSHRTKPVELYHIDIDGRPSKVSRARSGC
jgi:20S proteasome alpha/beta subunit